MGIFFPDTCEGSLEGFLDYYHFSIEKIILQKSIIINNTNNINTR